MPHDRRAIIKLGMLEDIGRLVEDVGHFCSTHLGMNPNLLTYLGG